MSNLDYTPEEETAYYNKLAHQAKAFLDSRPSVYLGDDSVDDMIRTITARAHKGEQESVDFLNQVEWGYLMVPDPLGWANRPWD